MRKKYIYICIFFLKRSFFWSVETSDDLIPITVLIWDGREELFEDILAITFPNLFNNINTHIKQAQWNANRMNLKKNCIIPYHNQIAENQWWRKIFKVARGEKHIKHRRTKLRMTADISSFNHAGDIINLKWSARR